jgi:hypothetical protein
MIAKGWGQVCIGLHLRSVQPRSNRWQLICIQQVEHVPDLVLQVQWVEWDFVSVFVSVRFRRVL